MRRQFFAASVVLVAVAALSGCGSEPPRKTPSPNPSCPATWEGDTRPMPPVTTPIEGPYIPWDSPRKAAPKNPAPVRPAPPKVAPPAPPRAPAAPYRLTPQAR